MFHAQKYPEIVCIFCGDSLDTVHRYSVSLSLPCIFAINSVFVRKAR